jgi:hypothetical protein
LRGGAAPFGFGLSKGAGVDVAFFLFVPPAQKPFSTPNSRSTLIFDFSL